MGRSGSPFRTVRDIPRKCCGRGVNIRVKFAWLSALFCRSPSLVWSLGYFSPNKVRIIKGKVLCQYDAYEIHELFTSPSRFVLILSEVFQLCFYCPNLFGKSQGGICPLPPAFFTRPNTRSSDTGGLPPGGWGRCAPSLPGQRWCALSGGCGRSSGRSAPSCHRPGA